jgi:hypothetical protein
VRLDLLDCLHVDRRAGHGTRLEAVIAPAVSASRLVKAS